MKKIIFCVDMQKGKDKLNEIIEYKKTLGIYVKSKILNNNTSICLFDDDEYWEVMMASENCRGQKVDMAFFDNNISDNIRNMLINCCCNFCDKNNIFSF